MQSLKYKIAYDHQINGMTLFQLGAKYNLSPYNVQSLATARFEFTEPIERLSIQRFKRSRLLPGVEVIEATPVKKRKRKLQDFSVNLDVVKKEVAEVGLAPVEIKKPDSTIKFGSKTSSYYKDEMDYGFLKIDYEYNWQLEKEYETQTSNKLR